MILVIGEILFDMFPNTRRIGGAPFNFAFHLSRLGFEVAFVSRVGRDDLGDEILDFVGEKGLDPGFIQTDPAHGTGVVDVAMAPDGGHSFSILADRAYDHLEWNETLTSLCRSHPAMVYFGTLIQRTPRGKQFIDRAMSLLGPQTTRFCDINLRPRCHTPETVRASVARSDILKLSIEELDLLVPDTGQSPDTRAASLLSPDGPFLIVLTRGRDGAVWLTAKGSAAHPVPEDALSEQAGPEEASDTVGAGDAYAAMAAAGRLSGLPDSATMRLAQEFAGAICRVRGALPEDLTLYQTYRKRLSHDP